MSSVSLKANGLRLAGGLDCPAGGTHSVPGPDVVVAKVNGGGRTTCVKCRSELTLVRA
jgi:hypothetical protein